MQQIHDKGGAKQNLTMSGQMFLTYDHCDGVINKHLLQDISADNDVIIQKNNKLNKRLGILNFLKKFIT